MNNKLTKTIFRRMTIPANQPLRKFFLSFLVFFTLTISQSLMAQPSTPAGFVANPASGAGEVFLAVGPNQVSDACIEYRLFFSPTATAPADPLTATEYIFGSTPGDGGGNNAFGFTLSGLTPDTEYTFWLYQYNSCTMEFSAAPAAATQTSGAQGPPATPVGFVCNMGNDPGQIFLAVGPNNVSDPEISYRLFFSPEATAPADPLTATEYTFGSTAGDGGGNNAFGFTMSGLTPGISYVFYLYQYNSTTMEFSENPAECTTTSALPVELTSFSVALTKGNQALLKWSTASEFNNDYFNIERSVDAQRWESVGKITGSGNSVVALRYQFTDFDLDPSEKGYYYRLQQVDFDGRFEYFDAKFLSLNREDKLSVYPNPVNNLLFIEGSQDISQFSIYSSTGVQVTDRSQFSIEENKISIDLSNLANGMYILVNGDKQVTFIKSN